MQGPAYGVYGVMESYHEGITLCQHLYQQQSLLCVLRGMMALLRYYMHVTMLTACL